KAGSTMSDLKFSGSPEHPAEIRNELFDLLYKYAPTTLLSNQLIALIVVLALYHSVDPKNLFLWLAAVTLLNLLRLGMQYRRTRSLDNRRSAIAWLNLYIAITFFAGLGWAMLLLFFDSSLPLYSQLLILIVLVGMPVASMPNNAVILPVFYAFTIPILIAIQAWALLMVEQINFEFSALGIAFAIVLLVTGHAFHKNLKKALEGQALNKRLVEELSQTNRQLEEYAYIDPLTGLTNRRLFHDLADNALERCKRTNNNLALILIDLDNFKEINDTHGHSAGDRVLVAIAEYLKSTFRQTDAITHGQVDTARFGGDEFIVLLENIHSSEDVAKAARRFTHEVRQPVAIENTEIAASCSMGIALYPDHGETIAALIRNADIALYRVKDAGRNDYQFFDTDN
ncbi:MAG: GGDEF domain-containing protein, partial [Pseudomonadota bacterium]